MRWLLLLVLFALPLHAQERFLRVDLDLSVIDPVQVYDSARAMLVAKHGLTETEAVELLRPAGVTNMELCVELLLLDRLGSGADGLRVTQSLIDRNVKRADP